MQKKFAPYLSKVTSNNKNNNTNDQNATQDKYGSIQEKYLEEKIKLTNFYQEHKDKITLVSQYEVGEYIKQKYNKAIPAYETD